MPDQDDMQPDEPAGAQPSTAQAAPAKADGGKAAKSKATRGKAAKAKAGRGKAGKGKAARGKAAAMPSVANHPRAGAQIARAKGWGGLVGFLLVGLLSLRAGVPTPDAALRALAGGVVGYVATWAGAVLVWRHLVVAELRAVRSHRAAEAAARRSAACRSRVESAQASGPDADDRVNTG